MAELLTEGKRQGGSFIFPWHHFWSMGNQGILLGKVIQSFIQCLLSIYVVKEKGIPGDTDGEKKTQGRRRLTPLDDSKV